MSFKDMYKDGVINFLEDLGKVFPNHPNIIKVMEKSDSFNFEKHRKYFLNLLKPVSRLLENRDIELFDKKFQFIPMIDLSPLWKDLSETNKVAVWKHLQSLFIIAEKIESIENRDDTKVNNFQKNTNEEPNRVLENMINQLKQNPSKAKKANKKLASILNQADNPLVKLASDISKDVMKNKNPGMTEQDFIKSLMDPTSGGGMNQLMSKIQGSFEKKVKSGEINMKTMEDSAKKMASQLEGVLPGSLSGMFNGNK